MLCMVCVNGMYDIYVKGMYGMSEVYGMYACNV